VKTQAGGAFDFIHYATVGGREIHRISFDCRMQRRRISGGQKNVIDFGLVVGRCAARHGADTLGPEHIQYIGILHLSGYFNNSFPCSD